MTRKKVDSKEFAYLLASLELSTTAGMLPSPCIGLCRVDTRTSLCVGCLRTVDEITTWGGASEDDKHLVWHALKQRYAASLT